MLQTKIWSASGQIPGYARVTSLTQFYYFLDDLL
jgi:hypothetical protein